MHAVLPSTLFAYSYDAVGNRLSRTIGSATDTYEYGTTSNPSNRLTKITPASGPVRNIIPDLNGSTTNDAINVFTYDARGRLAKANTVLGTVQYGVNALGQRIRKTGNQVGDTIYHYDSGGRLIVESTAAGVFKTEYIYLGDIPVAVMK